MYFEMLSELFLGGEIKILFSYQSKHSDNFYEEKAMILNKFSPTK